MDLAPVQITGSFRHDETRESELRKNRGKIGSHPCETRGSRRLLENCFTRKLRAEPVNYELVGFIP
jgi:hypothetical protein